ncbi:MAG: glycosyl transferase [Parcubacteria group bacterium]|nr:glycosyl transferase [Parcubacteria group bacterium]
MDTETYTILSKMGLPKIILIKLEDFEDKELLKAKGNRTLVEYYFTCTPSLPRYILKNENVESVAYLDADLYFYSSPESIYKEFSNSSVMIIPHRFPQEHKNLENTKGIYNVGMLIFKNNKYGLECLEWWRKSCLEWCHNYYEDGKFGDQLYLNDWPKRFKEICVLQNLGANVASWNVKQYSFHKETNVIYGNEKSTGKIFHLIFYHFHGFKLYKIFNTVKTTGVTTKDVRNLIFKKYLETAREAVSEIKKCNNQSLFYGFEKSHKYFIRKIKKIALNNGKMLAYFHNKKS